jgi:hypothetical protein
MPLARRDCSPRTVRSRRSALWQVVAWPGRCNVRRTFGRPPKPVFGGCTVAKKKAAKKATKKPAKKAKKK